MRAAAAGTAVAGVNFRESCAHCWQDSLWFQEAAEAPSTRAARMRILPVMFAMLPTMVCTGQEKIFLSLYCAVIGGRDVEGWPMPGKGGGGEGVPLGGFCVTRPNQLCRSAIIGGPGGPGNRGEENLMK
jgi:hypothetical protein